MTSYFTAAMRKRAVELNEKKMDAETRAQLEGAKGIEVKNFIAAKAIGMRWILIWKVKDDGSCKPKARAILLGYPRSRLRAQGYNNTCDDKAKSSDASADNRHQAMEDSER